MNLTHVHQPPWTIKWGTVLYIGRVNTECNYKNGKNNTITLPLSITTHHQTQRPGTHSLS
jgi:hypothetical protein